MYKSIKSILITGGTGTFGKAFIKYALDNNAYDKIIVFSRDEYKQHKLNQLFCSLYSRDIVYEKIRFFLGDVRDKERLTLALRDIKHVVHAAALKHVPFCEYNPSEAIKTNVIGTQNVCDAAIEAQVEKVIVLSTDKAVEPINFYGSTKMLAEKYAVFSNSYSKTNIIDNTKLTRLGCVRYGNVIGSRGSIIETFRNAQDNDYFTITDKEMTRFWMHINDSVKMVMWGLNNIVGGEVIIPKLKASRVLDIALTINPNKYIEIVGIRPGEKIHEQLFNRRETLRAYDVNDYYIIVPEQSEWKNVDAHWKQTNGLTMRLQYFSNDNDLQLSNSELKEICRQDF